MKRAFLLIGLCLILLIANGCTYVNKISAQDIKSITVTGIESGKSLLCSEEQVKAFAEAYNSAVLHTNEVGTTHPYRADITFLGGRTLTVWGGTQGFCTIISEETVQQNIKSLKLDNWFDGLGKDNEE